MKTNPKTTVQKLKITKGTGKQAVKTRLEVNEAGRVHLAIDVHARHCVVGAMRDADGAWLGEQSCPTEAAALQALVGGIKAGEKWLTFEEGGMSLWLCDALRHLVHKLIVCDPRENALIGRSAKKRDDWDVRSLCRLMRLGELREVWHSPDPVRNELLLAAEQYVDLRAQVVRSKNVLKAWYRRGGVMVSDTSTVYSARGRGRWLARLAEGSRRIGALGQYAALDALVQAWEAAWQRLRLLGRQCPEIAAFEQMPGVGEVCSHLFSALLGDARRFATRQKLWRYCKLAVTDRSSDGKELGYKRLERRGNGRLKEVSYQAWKGAVTQKKDNEVKRFYAQSLERTGDKRHARLNTQRKILEVLWTLWRRSEAYDAQRFSAPQPQGASSPSNHEVTPTPAPSAA